MLKDKSTREHFLGYVSYVCERFSSQKIRTNVNICGLNGMNGIVSCVEEITNIIQSDESINWDSIKIVSSRLCEENATIGAAITNVLLALRVKQENELAKAKRLFEERCSELDLAVAKLQIAEQNSFIEDESSESDESNVPPLFVESQSEDEIFEFEECPTISTFTELQQTFEDFSELRIEQSQSVHIDSAATDDGEIESYKKEVTILQQQNKKYLEIGLKWKDRYKKAMKTMEKQTQENAKEMEEICKVIGKMKNQHANILLKN